MRASDLRCIIIDELVHEGQKQGRFGILVLRQFGLQECFGLVGGLLIGVGERSDGQREETTGMQLQMEGLHRGQQQSQQQQTEGRQGHGTQGREAGRRQAGRERGCAAPHTAPTSW
jgi:hypothetical protein